MNIFKLILMLLDVNNWKVEYCYDIIKYKHISGYYTYVGYVYFHKHDMYEVPIFIYNLIDFLFKRLVKKLKSEVVI